MKVETYEISEVTDKGCENPEDYKALIGKLELDGQEKFVNGETQQVFPYRKMSKMEALVYNTLLPKRSKLRDYSDSLIPLRVLQIASHVVETGFVDTIEIWHPENADFKDPLLVGKLWKDKKYIDNSYSDHEVYIFARWGEVLEPFEKLKEMAKEILFLNAKHRVQKELSALQTAMQNLETLFNSKFEQGKTIDVGAYCH